MKHLYLSATLNIGALLGHEFAAWASCYTLAKMYDLTFAHQPFMWFEDWLQLGKNEVQFSDLKAPVVHVPCFEFPAERHVLEDAIASAPDGTVLHLAVDQFVPFRLFAVDAFRHKWRLVHSRKVHTPYIASHIRRGQIMDWTPEERAGRFFPNEYFVTIANAIRARLTMESHVYSMGQPDAFQEFGPETHIHLGLHESDYPPARVAMEDLIDADILVMSKSGFSYMAALLSEGVKVTHHLWASPPSDDRWVQADAQGKFDIDALVEKYQKRG